MPGSITFEIRIAQDPPLHLDIPLDAVAHYTTAPVRWLRLVGYGTSGVLKPVYDSQTMDQSLPLDTPALIAGRTYVYDVPDFDPIVHCLLNLDDICRQSREVQDPYMDDDSASSASASTTQMEKDQKRRIPPYRLRPLSNRDARKCVFGVGEPKRSCAGAEIIKRELGWTSDYIWRLAAVRHFSFGSHLDIRNGISLENIIQICWEYGEIYILATDERFMRDADVPQPSSQHPVPECFNGRTASNPPIVLQFSPAIRPEAIIALTHRHQERAAFAGTPLGDDEPCPEALHYIYAGGMLLRYLREEEKDKLRRVVLPAVPEFKYDAALWQKDAPAVTTTRRRRRSLTQREKAQGLQLRMMANVAAER
ncbi:hypothetical protein EXIGLDRAFT_732090, partial [Exidia glandulosa HHB12029]